MKRKRTSATSRRDPEAETTGIPWMLNDFEADGHAHPEDRAFHQDRTVSSGDPSAAGAQSRAGRAVPAIEREPSTAHS